LLKYSKSGGFVGFVRVERLDSARVIDFRKERESDLLKVLQFQFQRWAFSVFWFIGLMAHQIVDQAVRGFGRDQALKLCPNE
jgi:hypothetical protein